MFERTRAHALPMANQAADSAPVVVACCNACRVCVTSNVVGVVLAAGAAIGGVVTRYLRRNATTSPSSEPT